MTVISNGRLAECFASIESADKGVQASSLTRIVFASARCHPVKGTCRRRYDSLKIQSKASCMMPTGDDVAQFSELPSATLQSTRRVSRRSWTYSSGCSGGKQDRWNVLTIASWKINSPRILCLNKVIGGGDSASLAQSRTAAVRWKVLGRES